MEVRALALVVLVVTSAAGCSPGTQVSDGEMPDFDESAFVVVEDQEISRPSGSEDRDRYVFLGVVSNEDSAEALERLERSLKSDGWAVRQSGATLYFDRRDISGVAVDAEDIRAGRDPMVNDLVSSVTETHPEEPIIMVSLSEVT